MTMRVMMTMMMMMPVIRTSSCSQHPVMIGNPELMLQKFDQHCHHHNHHCHCCHQHLHCHCWQPRVDGVVEHRCIIIRVVDANFAVITPSLALLSSSQSSLLSFLAAQSNLTRMDIVASSSLDLS